jgi:hypothetical protein
MLDTVILNRDGWRRDEDDGSETVVETCCCRSAGFDKLSYSSLVVLLRSHNLFELGDDFVGREAVRRNFDRVFGFHERADRPG